MERWRERQRGKRQGTEPKRKGKRTSRKEAKETREQRRAKCCAAAGPGLCQEQAAFTSVSPGKAPWACSCRTEFSKQHRSCCCAYHCTHGLITPRRAADSHKRSCCFLPLKFLVFRSAPGSPPVLRRMSEIAASYIFHTMEKMLEGIRRRVASRFLSLVACCISGGHICASVDR